MIALWEVSTIGHACFVLDDPGDKVTASLLMEERSVLRKLDACFRTKNDKLSVKLVGRKF